MTRLGGSCQRHVWLLIGVVCGVVAVASAVYVVRQLSHGGLETADTAGLLALVLTVVTGLVAVVALWKQSQANTATFADAALVSGWAKTLAADMEREEGAVRQQLLGGDTRKINLAYRLVPSGMARSAAAPGAGRLSTDGPGGPAVPDIAAFYHATKPLRLVVTGAAGAGKTVSVLELLLALIESRAENDPVPVRIPLSRWDTDRQTLPQLLQTWLMEAHGKPKYMAEGLVRHGLVLPVLDGLDEMDTTGPRGRPDPRAPRATAVVRALNAYQRGREAGPLVLTCRTGHYDALTSHTAVVDAARISIDPVDSADAHAYLTGRALDPARWRPLTEHLAAEPGGMLAGVLSTPWRLGLTATVYHHDGDPGELLALPDAGAVDAHLLARYVPAATRTAVASHGYEADQVHRWLHHLTRHLAPTTAGRAQTRTATRGPEATDLLLHELWPLAGRKRVQAGVALLGAFITLPLAFTSGPALWLFGVLVAAAAGYLPHRMEAPQRWTFPFRSLRTAVLTPGFAGWLAGVILATLGGNAIGGRDLGTTIAMAGVIGVVTISGFRTEPGASRGGRAAIRNDALLGTALGIPSAIALGTAGAGAGKVTDGYTVMHSGILVVGSSVLALFAIGALVVAINWTRTAVLWGILMLAAATYHLPERLRKVADLSTQVSIPDLSMFGILLIFVFMTALGGVASRRYLVFLLWSRGRLPFRLGRFLDWAVEAGLLRYSGAAYQYRHRELQHWLRDHPNPPQVP
ncbi:NACHT domain-containing protein [Streptomyces sp. NPDC048057]|uniref:NACHT domain-containing protein n=1 Tax=Streptomyces sp. NPDC048057 TaxID=3155628 RepID=UPI0033C5B4D7